MNEKLTPQQLAEMLLQDPGSIRPFQKAYKAFAEEKSKDTFLDFLERFFEDYDIVTDMEHVYVALFILAAEDSLMQNPVVRAINTQSKSTLAAKAFENFSATIRKAWLKYITIEREPEVDVVVTEVDSDIRNHNFEKLISELQSVGSDGEINRTIKMYISSLQATEVEEEWFLNRLMNEALVSASCSSGVCTWLISNCDLMGWVTESLESFKTHVHLPRIERQRATQMVAKQFGPKTAEVQPYKVEGLEDGVEGSIDDLFGGELDPDLD